MMRIGLGQMVQGLTGLGKKFQFYSRYNRKSAESSKQRKDTPYIIF
jgi:hypothetical protein